MNELIRNELEHYGVARKSGRYKWGSGEDPYHHGQAAPAIHISRKEQRAKLKASKAYTKYMSSVNRIVKRSGRKSDGMETIVLDNKAIRAKTKYDKAAKKYESIKEERLNKTDRKFEGPEDKLGVLRSGSASKIYAHRKQLNDSEIQSAVNRLSNESKLRSISNKQKGSYLDKAENVSKKVAQVGRIGNNLLTGYNAAANIYNTFSKGKKMHTSNTKKNAKNIKQAEKTFDSAVDAYKKYAQKDAQRDARKKDKTNSGNETSNNVNYEDIYKNRAGKIGK